MDDFEVTIQIEETENFSDLEIWNFLKFLV